MRTVTTVGWASGVIDCSGSIVVTDGRLRVQLKKADREMVERVRSVLGGRVYGPHQSGATRADGSPALPSWTWTSDATDVASVIAAIEPSLGTRRRDQLARARARVGVS